MQGEHGISAKIKLPPKKYLDQFDRLELDFELNCPGMICYHVVMSSSPMIKKSSLSDSSRKTNSNLQSFHCLV